MMFGEPPSVEEPRRPTTWQSGFGDGLSQAFELVGPPVLLGLLGALLDGQLGTGPGFLIGLAVFGVVGSFAKSYYEFAARAARHDEGKPWARRRA
jgi:F0F1-type ATP synthase assembly protein I